MVDDASLLEVSAGGRSAQGLAFLQYCRAINFGRNRCSVVALVHGDTDFTYALQGWIVVVMLTMVNQELHL